jgi:hypothetical protein
MNMKKMLCLLLSVMILAAACGNQAPQVLEIPEVSEASENPAAASAEPENSDTRAEQFVLALVNGDYETAAADFDDVMRRAMSAAELQKAWEDTARAAGAFDSIVGTELIPHDEYDIYEVISRHEIRGINTRVVYSKDGQIAGLFFSYVENAERDLTSVERDGVLEIPVIIGEGTDFPLNGLLTMPVNPVGKIPAVVLVQGSGPSDMDGTLFGNRPYFDIAAYLSANGVAVIRHDKRSNAHGNRITGDFTVWEEAIEDALLAAQILKTDERIDPERIFIVGHSLGATLTPRIYTAAQEKGIELAGLVLMAGTPREFVGVALEQINASIEAGRLAVEALEGSERAAGEAEIAAAEEMLDTLTEAAPLIWSTPAEESKGMFWLGASFYYFQDLASPTFEEAVANIDTPMLIMQGARDFQILADVDFTILKDLLGSRSDVTFKLYDDLNHLFMKSTATNFVEHGSEIIVSPGKVDEQVLQDIVNWILNYNIVL